MARPAWDRCFGSAVSAATIIIAEMPPLITRTDGLVLWPGTTRITGRHGHGRRSCSNAPQPHCELRVRYRKPEGARTLLEQALETDPENARAHGAMGQLSTDLERLHVFLENPGMIV